MLSALRPSLTWKQLVVAKWRSSLTFHPSYLVNIDSTFLPQSIDSPGSFSLLRHFSLASFPAPLGLFQRLSIPNTNLHLLLSTRNNTLTYITPFRVVLSGTTRVSAVPNPSSWSNAAFHSWASKASPDPKIDVSKLAPFESGLQMSRLTEDEFVKRCVEGGLTEANGQALYQKLWKLIGMSNAPLEI